MIIPKTDVISELTATTEASHLLSPPSTVVPDQIPRTGGNYTNLSERFKLRNKNFKRQYAPLYASRLAAMKPMVEGVARMRWLDDPIVQLNDIQPGKTCVIIGTLFKEMQLKPNILRDLSEDINLPPKPERKRYTHSSDTLYLEDETQRVVLVSNISVKEAITGTVISCKGRETTDGKFEVDDWTFCGLPAQIQNEMCGPVLEDKYVAIISGISIGDPKYDPMPLQLFVDLVTGQLGSLKDQTFYSKVMRLIIAGDSLSKNTRDTQSVKQAKYLSKKVQAASIAAAQELDDVLTQLVSCIFVDLMPGEYDPANFSLPQQPLHRCIFPQAAQYTSFQSVTNPYEYDIDGLTFLGTSGQNIKNIRQYTGLSDPLEIAEITLKCRHLAPTCPDTLGCYPFTEEDPFILRECPHVYFVGNQKTFGVKKIEGEQGQKTLIVSVPGFFHSKQVVLVNLKDLSCFCVSVATLIGETPDFANSDKVPLNASDDEDSEDMVDVLNENVNILPDDDMDDQM